MLCFVIFSPSEILLREITLVHFVLINYCLCVNIYLYIFHVTVLSIGGAMSHLLDMFIDALTFELKKQTYIYIYIYSHRDSSL